MSVFERGPFWWYEFELRGQRYRGSCGKGCKSRGRALQIEATARAKAMMGELPTEKRKMLTLSEAAKTFLAEKKAAHMAGSLAWNTLRHYQNAWDAWLAESALAGMRVNLIRKKDIAAVRFPGNDFTQKNGRQALNAILEWCREQRLIASVPKLEGKRLRGRQVRITPEIERALRAHLGRDGNDVLTVMLDAMMRNSEVFAMRWDRVNWEQATYHIPEGKTPAARRDVPLSDRMLGMLKARQAAVAGEWVFPSRERAKGHRVTIAKEFSAARKVAGIDPSVKLYCARHTGASELSEAGVDLLTLRTLLGHEDISTTNKYLHGSTDKARDAVNARNRGRSGLKLVKEA